MRITIHAHIHMHIYILHNGKLHCEMYIYIYIYSHIIISTNYSSNIRNHLVKITLLNIQLNQLKI